MAKKPAYAVTKIESATAQALLALHKEVRTLAYCYGMKLEFNEQDGEYMAASTPLGSMEMHAEYLGLLKGVQLMLGEVNRGRPSR